MIKITTLRASTYLSIRFPEIKEEIKKLRSQNNFAGVLQAIVNYLKELILQGKIKTVSRLIKFVGFVYKNGNGYITEIVENLFVRSLESMHKQCNISQWKYLYSKLPQPFRSIYNQQYHQLPTKTY